MDKLYTKVGWKNEPDKTTPINETNLGKMDNGINGLDNRVIELDNNKVDKVAGKGLSTNDYTDAEKQKLSGIEAGAQVNSVTSVAGKTGAVELAKGDLGLGNVDNTSDANKPISTATQTALNTIASAFKKSRLWNESGLGTPISKYGFGTPATATGEDRGKQYLDLATGYVYTCVQQGADNYVWRQVDTRLPLEINEIGKAVSKIWDLGAYSSTTLKYSFGNPKGMYDGAKEGSNAYVLDVLNGIVYKNTRMGQSSWTWIPQANLSLITNAISEELTNSKTASGSMITLTDAAESNLVECVAEVEAVQEGSGDPSPDNIRPITGQTELVITDNGINQWDEEWELGSIDGTTGEPVSNSNIIRSKNFNRCDGGKTYYCKAFSGANVHIYYYDTFMNYISKRDGFANYTVTTPSNTAYFKIIIFGSTYNNNVSVNYPSTDHDYHAYQGKTYTIQLGDTIYGGELDVLTGKLRVDKKLYDLGNFSYGTLNDVFYTGSSSDKKPGTINVISSQYRTVDVSTEAEMPDGSIRGRFDSVIFIRDDRYTTPADFKAAMSGVQVCYEIKEPYTIQLTPQQIRLLKGTNNISCNTGDLSIEYYPDNVLGQLKGDIEDEYDHLISKITPRTAKVYSFHISNSESDPSSKVTYLDDAVGMTPAKMNYSTGKFDYGSWKDIWFVKECKPCILAQAGYVMKYLDPNDYTKDIDGNTVAIDGGLVGANVMIEFPKIWYKVVPDYGDENSASVYISPVKVDEGYKDYAYIDYQGHHKEHFYMPAYNGSLIDDVMRSLSGQQVSKTKTGQQEIDYCKANGDGWYTEDVGEIMLINFLLILMGKSTDTQTVFGQGLHTGGTEAINNNFRTGVHNTKGLFYGTNSGAISDGNYANAVKVFGMENYWGFQWRRYAGDMLVNGVRKIKLCYGNEDGSSTFAFNGTGEGYVNINEQPSGTSGGYISKMKFTHDGMYSEVSSGSSSTNYCDGQWFNNSYPTIYALRGGHSSAGLLVGALYVTLYDAFGTARWNVGAAPSWK